MLNRKSTTSILYAVVMAASISLGVAHAWAADGTITKDPAEEEAGYCHLKFPAIRPSTLPTDHPSLKRGQSGDVIDYYGPCDHDPSGKDEVLNQRHQSTDRWETEYDSD